MSNSATPSESQENEDPTVNIAPDSLPEEDTAETPVEETSDVVEAEVVTEPEPTEDMAADTPADTPVEDEEDLPPAPIDYIYNASSLFYIFSLPAVRDIIFQDEFHHRRNSTTVAPPETPPNYRARWNKDTQQWDSVADFRYVRYYDKATGERVRLEIGQEPDDTLITVAPDRPGCKWDEEGKRWLRSIADQIVAKYEYIREVSDAKTKKLETGCSQGEVGTWQRQESGARALTEDPEASSPDAEFVKALASARGITVEEQVAKIMAKVTFAVAYGAYVIGTQQKLEDQLKTATTQQDLDAVIWPEDPEEYATVIASL